MYEVIKTTVTLPVTIAGETREIEFTFRNESGTSEDVVAVQIGRGVKLHRAELSAVCETPEMLRKFGYRASDIVEVDGKFYGIQKTASVRNRVAQITEWADKVAGTDSATNQSYYGSL